MVSFFKTRKPKNDADARIRRLFQTIASLGLSPKHIVDVGANHGNWTRSALDAFPDASVTAFEPQNQLKPQLEDLSKNPRVDLQFKGVGDQIGEAVFTYHPRDDSSSFIYSKEEAKSLGFEQSLVAITTLDEAIESSKFGPADIIKIDAEGLDLKVLKGGTKTLSNAQVVFVEATAACSEYPNTATAVFSLMNDLDYRLFDITDLNRTPQNGVLWLIEIAFVRKGSNIDIASQIYL